MKLSAQSVKLVPHISRDFGVMFPEAAITRFVLLSCQLQRYFTIQVNDKFNCNYNMLESVLTQYLPTTPGYLPKWLLFISVVAIFNSFQTYSNLALTKKVYSNSPEQVNGLSARTFGTWTLVSSIIRAYAAYNMTDVHVYNLCIVSYVIALWHFGSEWLIFKTCKFDKGLFGPLIVSTVSISWMLLQKDYYTGLIN